MFEAKNAKPEESPVLIWLNGGPGCSSMMGLMTENGPCSVNSDGSKDADGKPSTTLNPHSWHNKANVIWVEQPAGTGFSTGGWDTNEEEVGEDMHAFLVELFKQLPQYAKLPLFISGESYAGHYIPAMAYKIFEKKKLTNFKGFAIGNGLTNVEEQYKWYPDMAKDGGRSQGGSYQGKGVITNPVMQGIMRGASYACTAAIHACNEGNSTQACMAAFGICQYGELVPYQLTGMNVYDIRIPCEKVPLCYDFSHVDAFFNDGTVQKELGINSDAGSPTSWSECNFIVNKMFSVDFMKNYHQKIPEMLEAGMEVLIYAGDVDYICNWLGNKAWTLKLDWSGKEEFNKAPDADMPIAALKGKSGGRHRKYKNLNFIQVYQAGHMVPMNQPEAA